MRADHPTHSHILSTGVRRNSFPSAQASVRLASLFAFGGSLWASGPLPLAQCASVFAFAVLTALSGEGGHGIALLRGELLRNAPSQIFETGVTLVALSMRLSPIERDLVAASLLNLLHRF